MANTFKTTRIRAFHKMTQEADDALRAGNSRKALQLLARRDQLSVSGGRDGNQRKAKATLKLRARRIERSNANRAVAQEINRAMVCEVELQQAQVATLSTTD